MPEKLFQYLDLNASSERIRQCKHLRYSMCYWYSFRCVCVFFFSRLFRRVFVLSIFIWHQLHVVNIKFDCLIDGWRRFVCASTSATAKKAHKKIQQSIAEGRFGQHPDQAGLMNRHIDKFRDFRRLTIWIDRHFCRINHHTSDRISFRSPAHPKRERKSKSILSHASQIICVFQKKRKNAMLYRHAAEWFSFQFFCHRDLHKEPSFRWWINCFCKRPFHLGICQDI